MLINLAGDGENMKSGRQLGLLALTCLVSGIIMLVYGVLVGDADFYLFLIFPVVKTSSPIPVLGIVLAFLGFVLFFMNFFTSGPVKMRRAGDAAASRSHGVILIGPVPIIFGSDRALLPWVILGIVLTIITTALFLLLIY